MMKGAICYAFYAHLQQVSVRTGDSVLAGTIIGLTGMSGNASTLPIDQAHLHFEVRTIPATGKGLGNHLDPALFFPLPEAENQNFASPSISKG
jgi:murein DD-endopeptidase MepM/ murein hydrolase activator NlpD